LPKKKWNTDRLHEALIPLTDSRFGVRIASTAEALIEDVLHPRTRTDAGSPAPSRRQSLLDIAPFTTLTETAATTPQCASSTGSMTLSAAGCRPRRQGRQAGRRRVHAPVIRRRRAVRVIETQAELARS
jgi:hypothetical protein